MTTAPASLREEAPRVEIIGRSWQVRRAVELTRRFGRSRIPVLIVGATGSGKELFARRVHEASGRTGTFVDVNCGALPHDLVEGLLFGRRRGAYTGAVDTAEGLVEAANGGTLFLDELSSLPREAQAKLLRVLEHGEVRRVGDTAKRRVDFRLVAAAQEDIRDKLCAGAFRQDLFQRIAGIVIELPSLTERQDDLLALAQHFARQNGVQLDGGVTRVLHSYAWPGNVRELKVAIERAALLTANGEVGGDELRRAIELGPGGLVANGNGNGPSLDERRAELIAACAENGWDARRTADALGIGRTTLFRRLKAAGLSMRKPFEV